VAVLERADRPRRRNSVLGICIRRNREFSRADHYVELAAQIETSNAGRRVAQSGFSGKGDQAFGIGRGRKRKLRTCSQQAHLSGCGG